MNQRFADTCIIVGLAMLGTLAPASADPRMGSSVSQTVHNLSVSGPSEVRSSTEKEVCKFCHIPHAAVVNEPLWGHRLSNVSDYTTAQMKGPDGQRKPLNQPDGSSRLCLSCHDGTVALGEIGSGRSIPMQGVGRLVKGQSGFLGTDLSGGHPISIEISGERYGDDDSDMGLRPGSSIAVSPIVKLDAAGKIQCTTCHDAHDDSNFEEGSVPHFWVSTSVTEVCLACHVLR